MDPPVLGRRSSFNGQHDQAHDKDAPNSSNYQDSSEPIVKSTDMPDVMQQHAIARTLKALEDAKEEGQKKSDLHNFITKSVKKEFDATYGGVWHCIAGSNFGSFVVHESRTFIYFYVGRLAILLYRSGKNQVS
jgi:dynein light chain LC8-type